MTFASSVFFFSSFLAREAPPPPLMSSSFSAALEGGVFLNVGNAEQERGREKVKKRKKLSLCRRRRVERLFVDEKKTGSLRGPIAPLCPGSNHQDARLGRLRAPGGLRRQCRGVWPRGRAGVWRFVVDASSSSSSQLLFLSLFLLFRRRRETLGP